MLDPNLTRKVAKSYRTALHEQTRAQTDFSREYWNGKTFGIVETYAEMTDQTWAQAERALKRAIR